MNTLFELLAGLRLDGVSSFDLNPLTTIRFASALGVSSREVPDLLVDAARRGLVVVEGDTARIDMTKDTARFMLDELGASPSRLVEAWHRS